MKVNIKETGNWKTGIKQHKNMTQKYDSLLAK